MTPSEQEDYSALRATVRERGTSRVWIFVAGLGLWAGLVLVILALDFPPAAALVSLLVLGAAFEAVFGLHVAVERIGRYLQVFHDDRWEQTAMDFGAPLSGTGSDPLFTAFFSFATLLNLLPLVAIEAVQVEFLAIGGAHGLLLARVITARRAATRQRDADLARFRAMRHA